MLPDHRSPGSERRRSLIEYYAFSVDDEVQVQSTPLYASYTSPRKKKYGLVLFGFFMQTFFYYGYIDSNSVKLHATLQCTRCIEDKKVLDALCVQFSFFFSFFTLSLMVGQSCIKMKRKATTGRIQRRNVRNMVSHTLGWFKVFLAAPKIQKGHNHMSHILRSSLKYQNFRIEKNFKKLTLKWPLY